MTPAAIAINRRAAWTTGGVLLASILAFIWLSGSDPRLRAEQDHGVRLPPSAHHVQRRADGWLHSHLGDHGIATMFEMKTNDLPAFVGQLRIHSRRAPDRIRGDPTQNGYNVWPQTSTFIPGNDQYSGFRRTWSGEALPIEVFGCSSPKGDWLHVEIWKLEGTSMLVKMYTDWN